VFVPDNPWVSAQLKLVEQVTSVSTTLSGSFLTSKPVSVSREATTGTVANTALTAPSGVNQSSQFHHGKTPPIDEFTGKDN